MKLTTDHLDYLIFKKDVDDHFLFPSVKFILDKTLEIDINLWSLNGRAKFHLQQNVCYFFYLRITYIHIYLIELKYAYEIIFLIFMRYYYILLWFWKGWKYKMLELMKADLISVFVFWWQLLFFLIKNVYWYHCYGVWVFFSNWVKWQL